MDSSVQYNLIIMHDGLPLCNIGVGVEYESKNILISILRDKYRLKKYYLILLTHL